MHNIAVSAVGGGVGQSILRALRLSPLPFRIIGFDVDAWSAGFYACDKSYILPPAEDASYIDSLISLLKQEEVSVFIPGSDPEVSAVAAMRHSFVEAGITPIVGSGKAVSLCRDKLATACFFHKHGLPFAPTVPAAEALTLADEVGFPLIVKPLDGSASVGVSVVFGRDELSVFLGKKDVIVQEYIASESWGKAKHELTEKDTSRGGMLRQEDEISVQILLDDEGNNLGQFTSRNVLKNGVPVSIDPIPGSPVEKVALEMVAPLIEKGLIGPCNLQCRITAKGPVFFEVNPRFTGITAVRAAMGFNEVEAVLKRVLLKEPLVSVRRGLSVSADLICSRYITEMIMPRVELEDLKLGGHTQGDGWSTTL